MHLIIAAFASVLAAVLTPALLLSPPENQNDADLVMIVDTAVENKEKAVTLHTGNGVERILLEDYLVNVVLAEMPASFHVEALKAQAVAARTFAMSRIETPRHEDCTVCADSSCCQAWRSTEDIREKLGQAYFVYIDKVEQAVEETKGEYLTYNGEVIEAVYFSCSGGQTESAIAVWGNEVPYLQSVESAGEEYASKFLTEKDMSIDVFADTLMDCCDEIQLAGRPESWVKNIKYTEGGGVESVEICGTQFSGVKLRTIFGLNSTAFDMDVSEENVVFRVRGYGHRVGMSQYGANAMAQKGADYKTILQYYYQGVEIKK